MCLVGFSKLDPLQFACWVNLRFLLKLGLLSWQGRPRCSNNSSRRRSHCMATKSSQDNLKIAKYKTLWWWRNKCLEGQFCYVMLFQSHLFLSSLNRPSAHRLLFALFLLIFFLPRCYSFITLCPYCLVIAASTSKSQDWNYTISNSLLCFLVGSNSQPGSPVISVYLSRPRDSHFVGSPV